MCCARSYPHSATDTTFVPIRRNRTLCDVAMKVPLQHNCGPFCGTPPSEAIAALDAEPWKIPAMSGDPFQVCFHPKLGVVINDPVAQMGLGREQMRLFKVG